MEGNIIRRALDVKLLLQHSIHVEDEENREKNVRRTQVDVIEVQVELIEVTFRDNHEIPPRSSK